MNRKTIEILSVFRFCFYFFFSNFHVFTFPSVPSLGCFYHLLAAERREFETQQSKFFCFKFLKRYFLKSKNKIFYAYHIFKTLIFILFSTFLDYNQNIKILHFCVGEIQAGRVNLDLTHPSDGKNNNNRLLRFLR